MLWPCLSTLLLAVAAAVAGDAEVVAEAADVVAVVVPRVLVVGFLLRRELHVQGVAAPALGRVNRLPLDLQETGRPPHKVVLGPAAMLRGKPRQVANAQGAAAERRIALQAAVPRPGN